MIILFFTIIAVVILLDQVIKHWAIVELLPVGTMDFLKIGDFKIMDLTYVENTGAAFSSFSGARIFLIVLPIVMIIFLGIYLYKDKHKHPFFVCSVAAIIGGGIGNLIDRIRFGYVVDYLDLKLFNFAIFNFADIFVVCGVICVAFYLIFIEGKLEKNISAKAETVKESEVVADE